MLFLREPPQASLAQWQSIWVVTKRSPVRARQGAAGAGVERKEGRRASSTGRTEKNDTTDGWDRGVGRRACRVCNTVPPGEATGWCHIFCKVGRVWRTTAARHANPLKLFMHSVHGCGARLICCRMVKCVQNKTSRCRSPKPPWLSGRAFGL